MHLMRLLAASATISIIAATADLCSPASSSGAACGVFGRLKYNAEPSYAIAAPQFVGSVSECASLCARRRYSEEHHQIDSSYCQSFLYETSSKLCQLGALSVENAVIPGSKRRQVFYDITCFNCGALCPHRYGEDLLDNGGFEDRLLGPWNSYLARIGYGKDSRRGYHCESSDADNCGLSQTVNMCPGSFYELKADYKAIATSSQGTFFQAGAVQELFMTYDDQSNFTAEQAEWKSLRLFVRATPNHVGPYFSFNGITGTSGDYYVDNVKFSLFPKELDPTSDNLIQNGGFEDGQISPWKINTNDFAVVSPGINSSHGLLLTSTSNEQGEANLRQVLHTKPGRLYRFSFDAVAKDAEFFFSVFIGPKSGYAGYTYGWQPGRHTFSIPYFAKTAKTLIRISISELFTQGTFLLDNFEIVEVAEPKPA